jgi:hypothetical protein
MYVMRQTIVRLMTGTSFNDDPGVNTRSIKRAYKPPVEFSVTYPSDIHRFIAD